MPTHNGGTSWRIGVDRGGASARASEEGGQQAEAEDQNDRPQGRGQSQKDDHPEDRVIFVDPRAKLVDHPGVDILHDEIVFAPSFPGGPQGELLRWLGRRWKVAVRIAGVGHIGLSSG